MVDHESGAEMARLLDQDHIFTKAMGGLFPERSDDFSEIRSILDVGCGPGGWAHEVAFAHQATTVVGIDISQAMIEYASTQARIQGLDNLSFRIMDITRPLDFPDNTFDLVNARLLGFLSVDAWPRVVQEYVRITRPGGIIRLTETEMSVSNSPALEKELEWFFRSLWKFGQSFSPNGNRLNITAMLSSFLRQAGCRNVQVKAHAVDWSKGSEGYYPLLQDCKVGFKLTEPFFLQAGVAEKEEMEQVYEQMQVEMLQDTFCAVHYLLTAWGEKA